MERDKRITGSLRGQKVCFRCRGLGSSIIVTRLSGLASPTQHRQRTLQQVARTSLTILLPFRFRTAKADCPYLTVGGQNVRFRPAAQSSLEQLWLLTVVWFNTLLSTRRSLYHSSVCYEVEWLERVPMQLGIYSSSTNGGNSTCTSESPPTTDKKKRTYQRSSRLRKYPFEFCTDLRHL